MKGIRRGHLKFYVLRLLEAQRRTGYGLMKAIEEETGFWKPSAGSLYPLLATMRDQGLIHEVAEANGTARWEITDAGRAAYAEGAESKKELLDSMRRSLVVFSKVFDAGSIESVAQRLAAWEEERSDFRILGPLFMDLHDALWALPPLSAEQQTEARRLLEETIEKLCRIAPASPSEPPPAS